MVGALGFIFYNQGAPSYFATTPDSFVGPSVAGFGISVAAGDFDGNGTDDLIVGSPLDAGGVGSVTVRY